MYEFQDLKETTERMRNEADLLLADLQEEIDLRSGARNASIVGKRENALQVSISGQRQMKSIVHSIRESPCAYCHSIRAL